MMPVVPDRNSRSTFVFSVRTKALTHIHIFSKKITVFFNLHKQNQNLSKNYREEKRRRNLRVISELLCFAKQMRYESGESLKGTLAKEFKDR